MKLKNYEWKEGDGIFKGDFTEEQWEFLKENLSPPPDGWHSTREYTFNSDLQCIACFKKWYGDLVLGSVSEFYVDNRVKPEDLFEEETTDYEPTKMYQLNNIAFTYGGAWADALGTGWHHGEGVSYNKVLINGQTYHKSHFNVATHYDEDEDSLSCKEDLMKEVDYLDLREHTEDQIRYLAKYFKFYDLEGLLAGNWDVVFLHGNGSLIGDYRESYRKENKIHYNDLFY